MTWLLVHHMAFGIDDEAGAERLGRPNRAGGHAAALVGLVLEELAEEVFERRALRKVRNPLRAGASRALDGRRDVHHGRGDLFPPGGGSSPEPSPLHGRRRPPRRAFTVTPRSIAAPPMPPRTVVTISAAAIRRLRPPASRPNRVSGRCRSSSGSWLSTARVCWPRRRACRRHSPRDGQPAFRQPDRQVESSLRLGRRSAGAGQARSAVAGSGTGLGLGRQGRAIAGDDVGENRQDAIAVGLGRRPGAGSPGPVP